ncbi:hypothetical protein Ciccas_004394 [Cichlidogyrus casuarinus]|uniref:Uncharacterized protein n=1 Tax=Cichlidogyrus casuarinus TaxID=1844966 RepID=A0ABD2QBL8_9PLAT
MDQMKSVMPEIGNSKAVSFEDLENALGLGQKDWWLDVSKLNEPYDASQSENLFPTELQIIQLNNWLREPFEKHPQIAPFSTLLVEKLENFADQYQEVSDGNDLNQSLNMSQEFANGIKIVRRGTVAITKPKHLDPLPSTQNRSRGPSPSSASPKTNLLSAPRKPLRSGSPNSSPQLLRRNLARRDTYVKNDDADLGYLKVSNSIPEFNLLESFNEDEENSLSAKRMVASHYIPKEPISPAVKRAPQPSNMPQYSSRYFNSTVPQSISKSMENSLNFKNSHESMEEIARQEEMYLRESVASRFRSRSRSPNNAASYQDLSVPQKLTGSYDLNKWEVKQPKQILRASYDILHPESKTPLQEKRIFNQSYDVIDPQVLAREQEAMLKDSVRNRTGGSGSSPGTSVRGSQPDFIINVKSSENISNQKSTNSTEDMARLQEQFLKSSAEKYSLKRSANKDSLNATYLVKSSNSLQASQEFSISDSVRLREHGSRENVEFQAKLEEASLQESMKKYQRSREGSLLSDSDKSLITRLRNSKDQSLPRVSEATTSSRLPRPKSFLPRASSVIPQTRPPLPKYLQRN